MPEPAVTEMRSCPVLRPVVWNGTMGQQRVVHADHHEWRLLDKGSEMVSINSIPMQQQARGVYDFYCIFCLRQTKAVRGG